jgi:hypothetical protein
MSLLDLKIKEKEALENIKQILDSDVEDKQSSIDIVVFNFIENMKVSNEEYKNNTIRDFFVEAKRLVLFTEYEIKEEI